MCVYFRTKLQVSSVILTSFSQGGEYFYPSPPPQKKQTPKKPTLIRVKSRTNPATTALQVTVRQTDNVEFVGPSGRVRGPIEVKLIYQPASFDICILHEIRILLSVLRLNKGS